MAHALADVVPLALGVALSPLPVAALLLMLLSEHEIANARAFVVGWAGTLAVLAGAAAVSGLSFRASDPPPAVHAVELATGVALLAAAGLVWRRRPRTAAERPPSRWLTAVDGISQPGAFGLAAALVLLNVKDAALTVGAGAVIADAELPAGRTLIAIALFTALASLTVAVPFGLAVLAGDRADPTLRRWHGWLERNGTTVVTAVIGVGGVVFVVAGLRGL